MSLGHSAAAAFVALSTLVFSPLPKMLRVPPDRTSSSSHRPPKAHTRYPMLASEPSLNIQELEGLAERGSELHGPNEVLEALGYEEHEERLES